MAAGAGQVPRQHMLPPRSGTRYGALIDTSRVSCLTDSSLSTPSKSEERAVTVVGNFHTASVVNMNLATGDYQALENLTSRTRYTARQIELLVGAAGGPPFQRTIRWQDWGVELIQLSQSPATWSIRFPLWRDGSPTSVIVHMTVEEHEQLHRYILESINSEPGYSISPDAVPAEEVNQALAEFDRRMSEPPRPRWNAASPAASVGAPLPVPDDLGAAVEAVIDHVINSRYDHLTALAADDGMPPYLIREVLEQADPPWRLYDAPGEPTYLWREAPDRYTVEINLTDAEHQDYVIVVELARPIRPAGPVTFYDIRPM